MAKQRLQAFIKQSADSFRTPTIKQKEAFGRLLHTLSAACYVGAASIMFSGTASTSFWYDALRVALLFVFALAFLIAGANLSKGE
jgi:hypothetical protein